ncbi:1660_t:CDS:2, partial [Dentiscutata heterogama]
NLLPSCGDPMPPELPEPSKLPEPEEGSKEGESNYETANEGDTSDSESEFNNKSESEEKKLIFRRIEDLAPKRLVETRRISDQATFENVEDQISDIYRRELAQLEGIKIKIVFIAHIYQIVQEGHFGHRIDQDIAFLSEILDIIRQNRIDQTVSRQYNEILDKIDEMDSYFALPKIWAKPQLGIINPQNTDERCFKACMKAYLASKEGCRQGRKARNLHNISRLQCFNNILDFSGINFLFTLRDINIFKENNPNYAVNVFYPAPEKNDKEQATRKLDPLCLSEYNYQREYIVDLILFTKGEKDLRDCYNINEIPPGLNTHYCLISSKMDGIRSCEIEISIMKHIKYNYHSRNNPNAGQREIFTEKDLKADSDPVENNIINEKTVKLQKQKPNSYGYALIQTDGKLAKEIVRRTPNSIAESWKSMQRDLEKIIKPKLRNLEKIKITERDW